MKRKYANRVIVILLLLIVFSTLYIVADAEKNSKISFACWENLEQNNDLNFIVLGTDKDEIRTDLILLCHYDSQSNRINAMQIPRDTRIETAGRDKKINSAYGTKNGIETVKKEVCTLTGIYPEKHIVLNFSGFRQLVDAIGGIEYDVPIDMKYSDPAQGLYINLKKGKQLLDGKKAEMLMRFRKNDDGSGYAEGDIGRLKAQKSFYGAVVRKILSFNGIMNIGGVMDAVGDNFKTNFSVGDFFEHISDFKKMNVDSVNVFVLPGRGEYIAENGNSISYYIADNNKLSELVNKYFN